MSENIAIIADDLRFAPRGVPCDLDRTDHAIWNLSWSPSLTRSIQVLKARAKHRLGKRSFYNNYDRAGCIFVHVPKNAGSSIAEVMFGAGIAHHTATYMRAVDSERFDRYPRFATIREPRRRFRSAFQYLKFSTSDEADLSYRARYLDDVEDLEAFISRLKDPNYRAAALRWPHFREQVQYVCDDEGRFMLDFIVAVEKLDSAWPHVQKLLAKDLPLKHTNRSPRAASFPEIDWSLVDEIYAADNQLWELANSSSVGIACRSGYAGETTSPAHDLAAPAAV